MSNFSYVVERLEGTVWVPKFRTNFEDEQFSAVAKNPAYRILYNGKDITSKYSEGNVSLNANKPVKLMKPSEYKALSESEQFVLQQKVTQLKHQNMKRADMFIELGVSEATYDLIRSQIISVQPESTNKADVEKPCIDISPKSGTSVVRRTGLLGRR